MATSLMLFGLLHMLPCMYSAAPSTAALQQPDQLPVWQLRDGQPDPHHSSEVAHSVAGGDSPEHRRKWDDRNPQDACKVGIVCDKVRYDKCLILTMSRS